MSVETDEAVRAQANVPPEDRAAPDPALGNLLGAGVELVAALRHAVLALVALAASEARVLRASVPRLVIVTLALLAFSVSLWACAVALIGWALFAVTGSIGSTLGVLVVLHLALVVGSGLLLKRALRQASFPATRSELRALGGELRQHAARLQRAQPPNAPADAP